MRRMGAVLAVFAALFSVGAEPVFSGGTVVFYGGTVCFEAWRNPSGYVRLCQAYFARRNPAVKVFGIGVNSARIAVLDRDFDRLVAPRTPTCLVLECGVNDIWPDRSPTPVDEFGKSLESLLDKCRKIGCRVLLLTPFPIGEDFDSRPNRLLDAYLPIFGKLTARDGNCTKIDLNAAFRNRIAEYRKSHPESRAPVFGSYTTPPDLDGQILAAQLVLAGLGVSPEEQKRAETEWELLPVHIGTYQSVSVPVAVYLKLRARAQAANQPMPKYSRDLFNRALVECAGAEAAK